KTRIPRQPPERKQIRHRQRRTQPGIAAHTGHADHSAILPGDYLFDGSCGTADAHVEVENLFPHGCEVDEVPLLPRVLLRDLHFHRLAGFGQPAEQRRDWLAYLEIDWPFFGLDD